MTQPAKPIIYAHRGRGLELVIIASQRGVVRLIKTHAGAKKLRSGQVRMVAGTVDFVGTVVGSGRAIYFDAKQTGDPRGFYLKGLTTLQDYHLALQHEAGAIAGVLAEATHPDLAAFYWISAARIARHRAEKRACVQWDDAFRLGKNHFNIDFARLVALEEKGQ